MHDTGATPRMPTHLWVDAEIRRLAVAGHAVYVVAKGDLTSGMVIQKIVDLAGHCRLLGMERGPDGRLGWIDLLGNGHPVPEHDADVLLERARQRDPDLWVVEIEDRTLAARLELY